MPAVNIATTVAPVEFPPGTALGQYRFRLAQGNLPLYTMYVDAPLPAVVTFPNVAAGDYLLTIQRQSAQGLLIGTAYSTPVSVAAPAPVVADAVVGATVSVG